MLRDLVSLGNNLPLIDELYRQYQDDPSSVDPAWRQLFEGGPLPSSLPSPLPSPQPVPQPAPAPQPALERQRAPMYERSAAVQGSSGLTVWPLVNAYRARGHMAAHLDPLGMLERPQTVELEPSTYGFTETDYDRVFPAAGLYGVEQATLREILATLEATYSGSIGVEFMHISAPVKKAWLAERMERMHAHHTVDDRTKRDMLRLVVAAETFERFCHLKFPSTKRFSIEGSEGLMPLLDLTLTHAARLGAIEAVIGMAHRGRLNVLVNTMGRKARELFAEFEDLQPETAMGSGDVKYHLGYSYDREDRNGRNMHLSLAFNPSHLEAVDPVVVGRVRAKQRRHSDWEHKMVVGILIHGDAAFAGQGLVPETLNLVNLHGYRTGGTVHIIVNNQIGFTASPREARSTPYCTDVAKMIQCPIFHVNGDDLDALAHTIKIAMEYRAQFKSDVVIDVFCYRQFGHNELDEPAFTQPQMYKRIKEKKPVAEIYGAHLVAGGVITAEEEAEMRRREREILDEELAIARSTGQRPRIASLHGLWSPYKGGRESNAPDVDTGVSRERLAEIAERITTLPEGLNAHRKVQRLLGLRAEMGRGERPVDWGMAEMLAYGSLLWDGTNVRISGQDSCRGTFSHRHGMVVDVETGTEYMLLGHLHHDQGMCRIYDSPLSEAGVLGFEFGYSLDYPDALVIWEAQFGDFANGAQVIIDQFILASEDKWNRLSGLTLLLPHGYEGQGPEHSSGRIERFLEGAAEDNIQVCQPTSAAQIFHLLRRQVVRPWRKPLIVFTPKSLLRAPAATSDLEVLIRGGFQCVLADPAPPPAESVERVFLCTGKVYYELVEERARRQDERSIIVRIEQLYPWRAGAIHEAVAPFANVREVVWVQEEAANMGAYSFVQPRLVEMFGGERVRMVSRPASASPATGSFKAHQLEQQRLMETAFAPGR